jgi:hypothetical protein
VYSDLADAADKSFGDRALIVRQARDIA